MFNIKPLNNEIIRKVNCSGCHDYVEVSLTDGSSRSCVILRKYMDELAERIKEMEIFEDDVWVVTFPKCGTTWSQEMVIIAYRLWFFIKNYLPSPRSGFSAIIWIIKALGMLIS